MQNSNIKCKFFPSVVNYLLIDLSCKCKNLNFKITEYSLIRRE